MSKSLKKPVSTLSPVIVAPAKPVQQAAGKSKAKESNPGSKQSRVIAMLQSPTGTTIAAMVKATGWQPHSVRGFLAGVVRKRLKLKIDSKKVGDNRVYRIVSAGGGKSGRSGRRPT